MSDLLGKIKLVIEQDQLDQKNRKPTVINKKIYLWTLLRNHGHTYQEIARLFKMNHATIIHGVKRYQELLTIDDLMLQFDITKYKEMFGNIPVPPKPRDLADDCMKALCMRDVNVIKRRILNKEYKN
jgi:hypothetical protein